MILFSNQNLIASAVGIGLVSWDIKQQTDLM